MQNSLIVASLAAALAALTAGIPPAKAEPISNAYPYCVFGRGGGSTTCYFRTRAECGGGCVNNPSYVGDARARALLAANGFGLDAGPVKVPKKSDGKALALGGVGAPHADARTRARPHR